MVEWVNEQLGEPRPWGGGLFWPFDPGDLSDPYLQPVPAAWAGNIDR
jgi:hypothetical protein